MTHFMHLSPSAYNAFLKGGKRAEMRLYDQKRRAVRAGDSIIFDCSGLGRLKAEVADVKVFKDFTQLYAAYSPAELGYKVGECARPEDMMAYYAREDEQKYGVVAIEVADIKEVL